MDASSNLLQASFADLASYDLYSNSISASSTKPAVEFRIQLSDLQGRPLNSVHLDDTFLLQVYVKDLRNLPGDSLHLLSAYTDLYLDPGLFAAAGPGRLGSDFFNEHGSVPLQGEIGGLATSPYENDSGHLLFEMPVRSISEGEGTIATQPVKNTTDLNSTLLYGSDTPVASDSIRFSALPISVLPKTSVAPVETRLPTLPVTPPVIKAEAHDDKIQVAQPVNTQVSVNPALSNALATTRPDPVRKSSFKITSDLVESAVSVDRPAFNDHPRIIGYLTEASDSDPSSLSDLTTPNATQGFLLTSYHPIQRSSTDSMPLLFGRIQNSFSSLTKIAGTKNHSIENPVASEVIDKMLERLEAFSSLHGRTEAFEWEASYARASLRHLPLYAEASVYDPSVAGIFGRDGYAEVATAFVSEGDLELEDSSKALTSINPDTQVPDPNSEIDFQRASLKLIPFSISREAPSLSQANSEAVAFSQRTDGQADEAFVLLEGLPSTLPGSRTQWTSCVLAGVTSLYIVFRGRQSRLQNRPDPMKIA